MRPGTLWHRTQAQGHETLGNGHGAFGAARITQAPGHVPLGTGLTVLAEADHKDTLPWQAVETARMLLAQGHRGRSSEFWAGAQGYLIVRTYKILMALLPMH